MAVGGARAIVVGSSVVAPLVELEPEPEPEPERASASSVWLVLLACGGAGSPSGGDDVVGGCTERRLLR